MFDQILFPSSRMLGYWDVGQPTRNSHFGTVNSTFAMDDVRCRGDEATIFACPHSTQDNCDGTDAAGVICEGLTDKPGYVTLSSNIKKNISSFILPMQILDVGQVGIGTSVQQTPPLPHPYKQPSLGVPILQPTNNPTILANTSRATATMMTSASKILFVDTTTAETSGRMQSLQLIAVFQVSKARHSPGLLCKYIILVVKLVGGSGPHEGNIFVGSLPVCDDGHDTANARVVCRFVRN